jgi:hypothetical protein
MVINRNGPGEAAVGMGVEWDVRRSDEDGAEGGVMSYDRQFTDGILAAGESRIDDEDKRGIEAYASTAFIASPTGRFLMPVERVTVPLLAHRRLCWAPAKRSVTT